MARKVITLILANQDSSAGIFNKTVLRGLKVLCSAKLFHPKLIFTNQENNLIKEARQIHLYLGTFFAPAIIFYALTGAFQTFQYHEEHEGRPAIPLFEKLAEIHKDQRVPRWNKPAAAPQVAQAEKPAIAQPNPSATPSASPEVRVAENPGAQPDVAKPATQTKPSGPPRAPRRKPSIPFKVFAVFLSVGLILSSCLGIYMAFKYNRDKRVVVGLLLAGTVLPAVLLYL